MKPPPPAMRTFLPVTRGAALMVCLLLAVGWLCLCVSVCGCVGRVSRRCRGRTDGRTKGARSRTSGWIQMLMRGYGRHHDITTTGQGVGSSPDSNCLGSDRESSRPRDSINGGLTGIWPGAGAACGGAPTWSCKKVRGNRTCSPPRPPSKQPVQIENRRWVAVGLAHLTRSRVFRASAWRLLSIDRYGAMRVTCMRQWYG